MDIKSSSEGDIITNLSISIDSSDYKHELDKKLKDYQKNSSWKGFRKGKVPFSIIKKYMGDSLKNDLIVKKINDSINSYFGEKSLNPIGGHLIFEDQDDQLFQKEDIKVNYKFLNIEQYNLSGIDSEAVYTLYEIELNDSDIEDSFDNFLQSFEHSIDYEFVERNAIVTLKFEELDTENILIEGGVVNVLDLSVSDVSTNYFNQLNGKSVGYELIVSIRDFDNQNLSDQEISNKYFYGRDISSQDKFLITVNSIKKNVPIENKKELYEKAFNKPGIDSKEEALSLFDKNFREMIENQALNYSENLVIEEIIKKNDVDIPKEFMEGFLRSNLKMNEQIDNGMLNYYLSSLERDMKYSLFKNKLAEIYNVNVDKNDMMEALHEETRRMAYEHGWSQEEISNYMQNAMNSEEGRNGLYNYAFTKKIFNELVGNVAMRKTKVSLSEFRELSNHNSQ